MQNKYNLSTKTTEILLLNNKKKKNNRDTTTEGCVTPSTCNLSIVPLFIKSTSNSKYRFFYFVQDRSCDDDACAAHRGLTVVQIIPHSVRSDCLHFLHPPKSHSLLFTWVNTIIWHRYGDWMEAKENPFLPSLGKHIGLSLLSLASKTLPIASRHFVLMDVLSGRHFVLRHFVLRHIVLLDIPSRRWLNNVQWISTHILS